MDKLDIIAIIEIIGVLLITAVGIIIYMYFKKDSVACLTDPVTYYEYLKNTSCFCTNSINP